jgi:protein-tyrosine phosphatase
MGLFSLFSAPTKPVADSLAFLSTDMHSHLLPGLDDGSQNVEESLKYIKELHTLGYSNFICTPHVISDLYPNNRQTIEPAYKSLKKRLKEEGLPVNISFAAEFMVNIDFEDVIRQNQLLPFGDNYLLIEMSYLAPSPNIKDVIFELVLKGFKPVLAHPERYNYYHHNTELIEEFKEGGCLLQLNLLSLTGYYGKGVKKVAEYLVRRKLVSFAGTDLHHERHLALLQKLAADKKILEQLHEVTWKNSSL